MRFSAVTLLPACLLLPSHAMASGSGSDSSEAPVLSAGERAVLLQDQQVAGEGWEGLREALKGGRTWLSLRYRFETVDQDNLDKQAYASTLRTVLGYETASWRNFTALLEFEDVHPVGEDDSYNSTINGVTNRPVVADPKGGEVNQAYLRYKVDEDVAVLAGRQRVTFSNHRFVGNVGWRQNEQTFDAVAVSAKHLGPVDLTYGLVSNVNRVFSEGSPVSDLHGTNHLLHASAPFEGVGNVNAYAYLLDIDNAKALSTQTFGASFDGKRKLQDDLELSWWIEAATQSDYADNPNSVDANYYRLEIGLKTGGLQIKVGNELLEGSGDTGDRFTTPLATLHAFNGWADIFLNTPDTGLDDLYASLGGTLSGNNLELVWHDFSSDSDSLDYGTEIDFLATRKIAKDVQAGFKYADYSADEFAVDTTKAWLWLGWAF